MADQFSTIRIDPVKLAEYMRSPSGPVLRRMMEDGELVKQEARRLVGVHVPTPGEQRKRRPGTLRDSIVKRVVDMGGAPAVIVGSADPIALWHHEGTQPHVIEARAKPFLVFWSTRFGRLFRAKRVNHPGTRRNPFLVNALRVLRGRT